MAHRTVLCATGLCLVHQDRTDVNQPLSRIPGRAPLKVTGLSGVPPDCLVSQRTTAIQRQRSTLQSATVPRQKSEQRSQRAPDCPVPQEDKAPTVDPAPNPNGWVSWRCTGQGTVPVQWNTGLSGAPIANSLPNGYGSGWGL
jgi:hypothetical protein